MNISGVIIGVSDINEKLVNQLKSLCKEIIYVPIIKAINKYKDVKEVNINFDGNISKLKNICSSNVIGDYVLFVYSNEYFSDTDSFLSIDFKHEAYEFNVVQQRPEGVVIEKQIRLNRKEKNLYRF
ncbi:hypothetical protein [Thermobrachium celere]|uniref:hypothetical protein n=1 Tax=Thermobrachium celere TaxID=53422 RepID=UPI00194047D2|nr:hypothetical protein [Thermobrachium celere]GFR34989.1 hypothetical protein TCEA9_08010 [Thermobrachium celere]